MTRLRRTSSWACASTVDRQKIQITRLDADGKQDRNEVLLRFEIANAHRVIAAIQKCCGAIEGNVEGNTVATT